MTKKGKNLLLWKCHVTMTKKDAYISNGMQIQNHSLAFIHKNKSLLSPNSIPSRSRMAQHYCFLGQANFNRLCGLWEVSRQIWRNFLVQKRLPLLGSQLKVFKRADENAELRLRQNLSMGKLVSTILFDNEII